MAGSKFSHADFEHPPLIEVVESADGHLVFYPFAGEPVTLAVGQTVHITMLPSRYLRVEFGDEQYAYVMPMRFSQPNAETEA